MESTRAGGQKCFSDCPRGWDGGRNTVCEIVAWLAPVALTAALFKLAGVQVAVRAHNLAVEARSVPSISNGTGSVADERLVHGKALDGDPHTHLLATPQVFRQSFIALDSTTTCEERMRGATVDVTVLWVLSHAPPPNSSITRDSLSTQCTAHVAGRRLGG